MENENSNNIKERVMETVQGMAGFMNLECQVNLKEEIDDRNNKSLLVSVYTPENASLLIGKNGQNLKALEQILRSIFLFDIILLFIYNSLYPFPSTL